MSAPNELAREIASRLLGDFALGGRLRTVIGIAGESGSGKTCTAAALAGALATHGLPTAVLHQDDYFHRPPRTNHEHRERDLSSVGPQEVNTALLAAHVAAFRAGTATVVAPMVDHPGNRFVTRVLDFGGIRVLVLEGTYVLTLDDLDIRLFAEATHEETRERRAQRARDIDAPFMAEVLRIEHAIIERQEAVADLVIDTAFRLREGRRALPAPASGSSTRG